MTNIIGTDCKSARSGSITTTIGSKVSNEGVNLLDKDFKFSFNIFAKANSTNTFSENGLSNDTKITFSGSAKIGNFSSIGVSHDKSLISGDSNTSYSIGFGNGSSTKIESGAVNQTTILNKTNEFN